MGRITGIAFKNALIEANDALIKLGSTERNERGASNLPSVRHGLAAYAALLALQQTATLLPEEAVQIQGVIDRLRATLRFFGKDV